MKRLPLLLLLAVAAAFIYGLLHLFSLRFDAGDIYPAYSSLRADPLGTKALCQSLDHLLPVRRSYQPFSRLSEGRGTAMLYLGVPYSDLRLLPDEFKDFEHFAADGGRLVIALFPRFQKPLGAWTRPASTNIPSSGPSPGGGKPPRLSKPKRTPTSDEEEFADFRAVRFTERWGLSLEYGELVKDDQRDYQPALARLKTADPLPESLACHTALYFDKLTNAWRVIYAREQDRAVVIERDFGSGTLVLMADSYHFSNEALRKDRRPELFAWLVGSNRQVIFDETHLGVQEEPGVATLARQYRLHGLFLALLALAALYVWKNSVSFMPPHEEQRARERGEFVTGKEAAAGFVNLLRRNLRASELLAICVAEWKKSCSQGVSAARLQQMQAIIDAENARPPKERNPVGTYRRFCEILATLKRKA